MGHTDNTNKQPAQNNVAFDNNNWLLCIKQTPMKSQPRLLVAVLCLNISAIFTVEGKAAPAKSPGAKAELRPNSEATGQSAEWQDFRTAHPYHIQGVAVSGQRQDGTRVAVIAEPPPQIKLADIKSIDPVALASADIKTHPIGHDGWVRDVVILLPPMTERAVGGLCSRINTLLFGTSYKAIVYEIPRGASSGSSIRLGQKGLDLHVRISDLQRWFLEEELPLMPALGGRPVTLKNLLEKGQGGVFFSVQEGLVAWLLPDGVDFTAEKFNARQFALDSDIVLGAISGAKGTAIIARERSVSVDVLPPLRTETIFQLAAARTVHLAQSYERTNAFAGRFNKDHDWAPIYLSDELIDTEYGSLLNITDQLLKSWSNSGMTRYERFLYPDPATYPFAKALPFHLGVNEVTYNWNTKGAGYGVESGRYSVLALNRTGALPVSYIPGDGAGAGAVMKAEDRAYEYFSGLGDPHLARVVQYAALYQAFVNLNVADQKSSDREPQVRVHPLLVAEMNKAYERLKSASEPELRNWIKAEVEEILLEARPHMEDAINKYIKEKHLTITATQRSKVVADMTAERRTEITGRYLETIKSARDSFLKTVDKASGRTAAIEEFVMNPKGNGHELMAEIIRKNTDLVKLRDSLVTAGSERAKGWIHTPAVVVSWNQGVTGEFVGGHNLDAKLSVFRADEAQPKGTIKLVKTERGGDRVIFNPADRDRVVEIVRDVGRRERDLSKLWPEIEQRFAAASARPIKPIRSALAMETRPVSSIRGLRPADVPQAKGIAQGWSSRTASTAESKIAAELQTAAGRTVVTLRSEGSGYALIAGPKYSSLKGVAGELTESPLASGQTLESMVDALQQLVPEAAAQGHTEIVFSIENLSALDRQNLCRSLDSRSAGDRMIRMSKQSSVSPREMAEIASRRYDASKLKISPVERRVTSGGEEFAIPIEIPSKAAGKPSLFARVILRIKGVIPEGFGAKIEAAVRAITSRLGADTSLFDLQQAIRGLRKEVPEVPFDVEFSIPSETSDITFVQSTIIHPADRHGVRYRLAA